MTRILLGLGAAGIGVLALAGLSQEVPTVKIGEYSTSLNGRDSNQEHNAMLCLRKIDGTVVKAGESFSFNDTVGPWSRDRGYRRAPVSFGGQMIDAWGGGVCQSSTTIYNAALLAGMDVTERASHHYAPTYVEPGRDAAVAFPNIDLVFTNTYDVPVTIHARVEDGQIRVSITGQVKESPKCEVVTRMLAAHLPQSIEVGRGSKRIVRNVGKPGFEVESFVIRDGERTLLSRDNYEVMNRVVERSLAQ